MIFTKENTNMKNDHTHSSIHTAQLPSQNDPFSEDCNITSSSEPVSLIIIRPLLEAILVFVSIFLNITIIIVVSGTKRLHTVPYVFIVSLAVSDLITASAMGVTKCYVVYGMITRRSCDVAVPLKCISSFLTVFCLLSNIGNHLMISIERWLYIATPFSHQRIVTRRTTVFCLISVWVVSVVVNLNLFFDRCGLQTFTTRVNIGIICPVFHFFLSSLMVLIYSHIAYITYRQTHHINKTRLAGMCTKTPTVMKVRTLVAMKWKSIRMLVIVFGTFFILVTPTVCADIYAYAKDSDFYEKSAGKIIDVIWSTHCFLNFCVYAGQDRQFRNALKHRLLKAGCFLCLKQVHPEKSSFCFKTVNASNA